MAGDPHDDCAPEIHEAIDAKIRELADAAAAAEKRSLRAYARVRRVDEIAKRIRGKAIEADLDMVAARRDLTIYCEGTEAR